MCNNCGAKRKESDYLISNIQINKDFYDFKVEIKPKFPLNTSENENKNITKNITKIKFGYMGLYNAYNCIGAIAFAHEIGIPIEFIKERIENFDYKLGRMETLDFKDKKATLVITKNSVGLSEVLNSISYDNRSKAIMFMLNDHSADGKDISWIWDANLEKINEINNIKKFYATGIRAEESALRIKYAGLPLAKIKIIPSKSKC